MTLGGIGKSMPSDFYFLWSSRDRLGYNPSSGICMKIRSNSPTWQKIS